MATLRKFKCYRNVTRAYTRKSKYKPKAYVKTFPNSRLVRFHMGDVHKQFSHRVDLVSKERVQVRDNALESARQVSNRRLEKALGRNGYYFSILVYPHHALRENKMLVGAGADRMQTGMQQAFGKVIGIAAQLRREQCVFTVHVNENGIEAAKDALKHANHRLPFRSSIKISEVKD
ncbi:50S ribosomal protein L16 [Candidatus Woesearchaeota archaeon]|nr:50S ribosomal protein L16 [Candidatus Woesearchaeota archaeon]